MLKYIVSQLGWAVDGGRIDLPPGTLVDTSLDQWAWLAAEGVGPPKDAVPLNQYTYDYMTNNNGIIGLGYHYWEVMYIMDGSIVPIAGDYGPMFRPGESILGGGDVLG